jgi:hypothetical protein
MNLCPPTQALLEAQVSKLNSEVERICSKHYEGLNESIESLINVRDAVLRRETGGGRESLQEMVETANESLRFSGGELEQKLAGLVRMRKAQRNILLTVEALTNCLSVIKLYCKANTQIREKRYYPALKTLRDLELVHLKSTNQTRYTFLKHMRRTVPVLRTKVQSAAKTELTNFLTDIRDHSREIGRTAMLQQDRSENGGSHSRPSTPNTGRHVGPADVNGAGEPDAAEGGGGSGDGVFDEEDVLQAADQASNKTLFVGVAAVAQFWWWW